MTLLKATYIGLLICSALSVVASYYWTVRYVIESENPLRTELLVGETLVFVMSSPIWIGLAVLAVSFRKKISTAMICGAFMPLMLMVAPMVFRGITSAL